ncbi:sigma-70 family RNA polymerase sigma factor [Bradyrhizobium sp. Arg237L]|uniref:RNA polymerase sigma factor n=1 Tax=Bradyrhizobium sp. Arg237L TaxID=3003352 RepID=UPI00249ED69E|nr:sigma-70 family RNA polymerase sigma factor [Bradyrhizobium sp. Arg237L]MDI4236520.1 sigma-70 family RNA polymerase sigma factor [Bradyrhizobium sp. Arg237L]
MGDSSLAIIRRLFVERYDDLKARLTHRLGSADLAGDAMHDAWLRLARIESVGTVQSPHSYLFRVALNVADDQRRREKRHRPTADYHDALEVPDEAATPEETLIAQADLEAFRTVLAELPEQRRTIFLAARVGNMPRQQIADRLGISRRSVTREILRAHKYYLARMKDLKGRDGASGLQEESQL